MKKIILLPMLLLVVFGIFGCGQDNDEADIYTTVYPIEFIVKEIVKNEKTVKSVYPRGAEVHDYEPYPKQIIAIADCDILFYVGLSLEPFITNALSSTFKDLLTVELSKSVELVEFGGGHTHTDEENNAHEENEIYDPHIWIDPLNMIKMTNKILEELIKIYPNNEKMFTDNAAVLVSSLERLHNEFLDVVNRQDLLNKTIMVDHDAYCYWTYRYGINRLKLRNDNESNEITPAMILEKVNEAKGLGIKYIVGTKNEVESATFNLYLKELGGQARYLYHLGTITTEELKQGENYISLMEYNISVLKEILPKIGE